MHPINNEKGPVYSTTATNKTAKWFEDVLGWYSQIFDKNKESVGTYGDLKSKGVAIYQHLF